MCCLIHCRPVLMFFFFFFFNDTATTEIYTLSLHDALPISPPRCGAGLPRTPRALRTFPRRWIRSREDRKSTRLNSSHLVISYAVFCLKKKKNCKVAFFSRIPSHDLAELQSLSSTSQTS